MPQSKSNKDKQQTSAARKAASDRGKQVTEQLPPTRRKPTKTKRSQSAVPTGFIGRAGRLAATGFKGSMRLAMLAPKTIFGKDSPQKLLEDVHVATAQELVETLGRLKGASMKVGQLASFVDAGILAPELRDVYQNTLGSLRDAAPPMKPKLVGQVFRSEFDADPSDLFASFEETPFAAASLGQVHMATLDDGRRVAVKLQYPGIQSAVKSDLALTAAVRPLLPLLAPGFDIEEAIEEIRRRVLDECDYTLEAENLDALSHQYEDHPFIWVPTSVPERSSERVLTMELAEGIDFGSIKKLPQDERDRIGEILFRFYYGSLHRYGFTSADPHPGNYKLRPDGKMAFFDFGLAFTLDPTMSPHLLGTLRALRDRDAETFFEHGVALRFVTRPKDTDPQKFLDWVWISLAPIREDREFTFTREFIAERTAPFMDPRNEWWGFIRKLNLPKWALLQYRLELGLFAVLAQLGATGNWHRMTMEFYGEQEPSTPLGQADQKWLLSKPH